jgi:hypothetical protein
MYGAIDRAGLSACHRLMYRCPAGFNDGLPIDFLSSNLEIAECVRAIRARELKYDVILVDPFHSYEASSRDLGEALNLLEPTGAIVVHDCFPRDAAIASPDYKERAWCGVTYKAYLDSVLASKNLVSCTVDIDYGCGVIRQNIGLSTAEQIACHARGVNVRNDSNHVVEQWKSVGNNYNTAFGLLQTYSKSLLNLVTFEEFLNGERMGSPLLR